MVDPAIGTLIVAAIAFLFASAAVHKFRDVGRFGASFAAYDIVPRALLGLAFLVPAIEAVIAAGLVWKPSRAPAAAAAMALLLLYAAAIALNLRRGRRDLDCGCGGPNDRRPIAAWMVWRNLLIASATVVALVPFGARDLNPTDAMTVAFGVLTVTLIYLSIDQLLGIAGRASSRGAS